MMVSLMRGLVRDVMGQNRRKAYGKRGGIQGRREKEKAGLRRANIREHGSNCRDQGAGSSRAGLGVRPGPEPRVRPLGCTRSTSGVAELVVVAVARKSRGVLLRGRPVPSS